MGGWPAPAPALRPWRCCWRAGLPLALLASGLAAKKTPVVRWGQRPDRLYLTIPLREVSEPEVTMEERRIYFKGVCRGEDYEVTLKLLRGINVTESRHEVNKWSLQFDLKKLRKEPCWKRLLRSKSAHSWLMKDHDRWYTEECQHAKELWREAYFTSKLRGEEPSSGPPGAAGGGGSPVGEERRAAARQWQKTVGEFRSRAVPRARGAPARKRTATRPEQDEL